MTPEQKLKHAILLRAHEMDLIDLEDLSAITADTVDGLYESHSADWALQDAVSEIRCSGTATGLAPEYSRHYESTAVAAKMPDGSWVGWTYWYGGGKHGEPEAIDWMEDAYNVEVIEERKMVTVQAFSRKD